MAKFTITRSFWLGFILLLASSFTTNSIQASCSKVTPSFSYTKNKSCGLPVTISFTNTSTGSNASVASYGWYIGTTLIKQVTGKAGASYTINLPGSYTFKLVATDTGKSPCKDSTNTTITITAGASPKIIDGNGVSSYAPTWDQCIATTGTPDTFGLFVQPADTLFSYTIVWGDATTNSSGSQLLKTQKLYHKYNNLGVFTMLIITTKNGCTDTLKGTVSNERNPVAGIVGPPSGTNAGCVPLKVRFINNSIKSSPSTIFTWTMGDGTTYKLGASTYQDTLYHTYKKSTCSASVKLTMDNACGSSFTVWNPIQASAKDSAGVTVANPGNCDLSKDFLFNNISATRYCTSPNPRKYKFFWGDGGNSGWVNTLAQQTHKYSARGTYTIMLIDSNSCGKDTAKITLKIDSFATIKSNVTPKLGCPPLTVSLKDLSTNISSRTWDFGDGTPTTTNQNVTHVYKSGGTYKAILTVGNSCGNLKDTSIIKVKNKVKSSYTWPGNGCAPYTVNFVNTSTPGDYSNITYKWEFGDGTTSTAKNPTKTYSTSGVVVAKLICTDSCGSDTFQQTFTAYGKPTGTITINSNTCQGANASVIFQTVAANYGQVLWGDGYTSNNFATSVPVTFTHKYDSAKTYVIGLLIMGSSGGCFDTIKKAISINAKPVISFTQNYTSGCGPLGVTFTNTSKEKPGGTLNNMDFLWNYSNGTKSYGKDSVAKFIASKTKDTLYTVKLIGSNQYGCTDSVSATTTVYPKPLSKFKLDQTSGCAPFVINTNNLSIPHDTGSIYIMKFIWNFGNGRKGYHTDTTAKYIASKTKDTVYNLSLIAFSEHGCMDTSYSSVRVYPKPLSKFTTTASAGCRPLNIGFNNQSIPYDTGSISIMSFNWEFGNLLTSTKTYPTTVYNDKINSDTVYNIRLIAISEHGCMDTSSKSVLLHPDPHISFNMSISNGCGPLPVNFTNNSINGTKFAWEFGAYGTDTARNPKKVFYGRPIFDSVVVVKLSSISKFGCKSDTLKDKVTVSGTPIANYLVLKDTFCFPDPVQFLNQSLAAYNYKWNLGDGYTTSTTNPKHFFGKSSSPFRDTTYFIRLVATSPYGCTDTAKGTMTVLPYPIPKFTADKQAGCSELTVKFTNSSVNVKNYFWVFGDGYSSTSVSPTHTYINSGVHDTAYHCVLYTYSADCVDSMGMWIQVYKPSFSFFRTDRDVPCGPAKFTFSNLAENFTIATFKWGDGSQTNVFDTTTQFHTFNSSPYQDTTYTIWQYVSSIHGCRDSSKRQILVPQAVHMGIKDTSYAVCAPADIQFVNYTIGARSYIWDFGDNSGSASRSPVHQYQQPGIFQYKLYSFDGNGCMDSAVGTGTIRVDASPKTDFDYSPGKGRMPNDNRIFFTDKSRSAIPLTYHWDFSDPAGTPPTSTQQNPTHDFSDSGNFNICLIANNGGCTDTFCNTVRIEPPFPTPDFTVDRDSGCPPLTVKFTNLSVNSDRYIWFFGDGDRSEDKDPTHTYRYSGYYDVTLVAKGPGGEGKTEKKYFIKVLNAPFTYFNVTPSVLYLPYATFKTRNLTTGAITYNWTVYYNQTHAVVGTSTKSDPYFTITDTGWYDVRLISMSNQGCFDTLMLDRPLYVNPKGMIFVPTAFTPTHDDRNEIFRPDVTNITKDFYSFTVFNRWGQKVFETEDPTQGWDGTFRGELCPIGVYVYKVKGKFINGDDVGAEGVVHLIR